MTSSHDPFPRRHSSHETLDAYMNGRRVVTILPADSCATHEQYQNANKSMRNSDKKKAAYSVVFYQKIYYLQNIYYKYKKIYCLDYREK